MSKQGKNIEQAINPQVIARAREGLVLLLIGLALFFSIALLSYSPHDPSWTHTTHPGAIHNATGSAGAHFADIVFLCFGFMAYAIPLMVLFSAVSVYRQHRERAPFDLHFFGLRLLGFVCVLLGSTGILSLLDSGAAHRFSGSSGGILGDILRQQCEAVFNAQGSAIVFMTLVLLGGTLVTGVSWFKVSSWVGQQTLALLRLSLTKSLQAFNTLKTTIRERKPKQGTLVASTPSLPARASRSSVEISRDAVGEAVLAAPEGAQSTPTLTHKRKRKLTRLGVGSADYHLPDIELLDAPDLSKRVHISDEFLHENSRLVEAKLNDFNIDAKVVAVHPGPVITRYELQLAPGVKVSKVTALAKDLARSLSVFSVRVVEVIPGKTVIGLELPNENREVVRIKEIVSHPQYQSNDSPLSLALGKDIAGHPVIVDLGKMPHLLVAGTTGSGKSVGLNAMLLSLLYKATPDEVRMIMVDPKMLELSIYDGIPHLLTPVVTDMKEAANALRWCVAEMDNRYQLMSSLGVRNLAGYNQKVEKAIKAGEPIVNPMIKVPEGETPIYLEPLPYIVVLVDEFADMMMVVGKKVEELIARIAQKARAAGIHLILATQRPSVDVITGLIKANVPTRMAFQVSSKVDSRTIIDQQGAEQLLGYGDMLYLAPGTGVPIRVHGAYVADQEVHAVVNDLKSRGEPDYLPEITQERSDDGGITGPEGQGDMIEVDALYDQAVRIVTETRRASISMVQRRLKIGYNRAARILEEMELNGVVSVMEGNGQREVLAPPPPAD